MYAHKNGGTVLALYVRLRWVACNKRMPSLSFCNVGHNLSDNTEQIQSKADGVEPAKPYSGKLNLRMSSELHSRVAAFVASTGTTINDFINRAIKNELKKVAAL